MQTGFDNVFHITQCKSVALGAVIVGQQWLGFAWREAGLHLVAAEGEEANGLPYGDATNAPAELRFIQNSLKEAARSARRNYGVTHAFHFHFRPGETSEVAPSFEVDRHKVLVSLAKIACVEMTESEVCVVIGIPDPEV